MFGKIITGILLVGLVWSTSAQDKVTLVGGRVLECTVTKVAGGNIHLKMAAGEVAYRLADITGVEIKQSPQIEAALKANETKKYAEAIPTLKAAVDRYVNLPAEWLPRAYAILGESYIATNKWAEAVDTFKKLLEYFPDSPYALKARVGLGRALVNEKKYDEGLKLLEEATEPIRTRLQVTPEENYFLGPAMVAIGDCYAAKGEWDKALNCYLSTVVIYWRNEDAVKQAQQKAAAMKEKLKSSA